MTLFGMSRAHGGRRALGLGSVGTGIAAAALLAVAVPAAHITSAAGALTSSTGTSSSMSVERVGTYTVRAHESSAGHAAGTISRLNLFPYASAAQHAAQANAAASGPAATVPSTAVVGANTGVGPSLLSNFAGLNSTDNVHAIGGDVEPPDQGLCVSSMGEMELVNLVESVYSPSGTLLSGPTGLPTFFNEPAGENTSDPRCFYDPASNAFFATIVAYNSTLTESHVDIAVNPTNNPIGTWTIYRVNTTDPGGPGCGCLADQPLLGIDAHGFYISINEFGNGATTFNGAHFYALDKAQLVGLAPSVFTVFYKNLMNGGTMAASMEPAITTDQSQPAEYFMDSLDPNGTTDNRLGVWALTNTAALDTGGTPTLSNVVITSETYGLPPAAQQKGSSATLNSDDDRMLQVQNFQGTLWGSLNTVVKPSGDTTNRVGAAYFNVVPTLNNANPAIIIGATISQQGILASKGLYLLYPAIAANDIGHSAMIFTATGSSIFPSVAAATGTGFTLAKLITPGTQSDHGFTCNFPYGPPCRWGDYSSAVASSVSTSPGRQAAIWMGTEYIGGAGDSNSNWGTRLLQVIPQGG
ncbi:MAG: hypothetical protein M3Z66_03265 [Chloroflexota bacterium]|nr:hypothetical protein [Chloroflexota bacterium]